ncbi:MAG: YraN family protein [Anaerolineae bacterium]
MGGRDTRVDLGRQGEELATAYLAGQGYTIIARNWRTRAGELDIIARDGEWLVFVEVRARRAGRRGATPAAGAPEESVTPRKQLQLIAMSQAYLFDLPFDGPVRIDVIALELAPDGSVVRLNHMRDAVGGVA